MDDSSDETDHFWSGKAVLDSAPERERVELSRISGQDQDNDGGDEEKAPDSDSNDLLKTQAPMNVASPQYGSQVAQPSDPVTQRLKRRPSTSTPSSNAVKHHATPAPKLGDQAHSSLDTQNLLSLVAADDPKLSSDLKDIFSLGSAQEGIENIMHIAKTGAPKDESPAGLASVFKALASAAMSENPDTAQTMAKAGVSKGLEELQNLVQVGSQVVTGTGSGAGVTGGGGGMNPLAMMVLPYFSDWAKHLIKDMIPAPMSEISNQAMQSWVPNQDKTYMSTPPVNAPPFTQGPASPPPLFPTPQRQRTDDVEYAMMMGKKLPYSVGPTGDPQYAYFDAIQPKNEQLWQNPEPDTSKPFTPSVFPQSSKMRGFPTSGPVTPLKAPFFGDYGDPADKDRNPASIMFPYPGVYLELQSSLGSPSVTDV
jgi:hypothetical protein